MGYREFRTQGLFVGSEVVEVGCKTLIGQRLKESGMKWSVGGANDIVSLRCIIKSNRFEDYREPRALQFIELLCRRPQKRGVILQLWGVKKYLSSAAQCDK
jgi:hypothetical protein